MSLTDGQRGEVIRLRRAGRSFKEIVRLTGVTDHAVKTACGRAELPQFRAAPKDEQAAKPEYSPAAAKAARDVLAEEIRLAKLEARYSPPYRASKADIDQFIA